MDEKCILKQYNTVKAIVYRFISMHCMAVITSDIIIINYNGAQLLGSLKLSVLIEWCSRFSAL